MRIRKPIIIFANKKKTKSHRMKRFGKKSNHNEQAATMENASEKEIPAYERFHSSKRKHGRNRLFGRDLKGSSHLKTIAVAVISAIVIGTFLGFIMLNMFDGIGTATNGDSGSGSVSTVDSNNSETAENESAFDLDPLQAFVLQGGVFSDEENASDWVHKFQKADHPALIWERDSQFTLLTGIASNEGQAKELAKDFSDEDIYVKEWATEKTDITVTKAEAEWLKAFADVWEDSVKTLSDDSSFTTDAWDQLLDEFPKQAQQLTTFQEELQKSLDQVKKKDNKSSRQLFLLEQWLQYEKIGRNKE